MMPEHTSDPASQLLFLRVKAETWANLQDGVALSDSLHNHMDSLEATGLGAESRMLWDEVAWTGWDATLCAVETVCTSCGRLDAASISAATARMVGDSIGCDDTVDLGEYGCAVGMTG